MSFYDMYSSDPYDEEVHVLRRHRRHRGHRRPQPGGSSNDAPIMMRTQSTRGETRVSAPRVSSSDRDSMDPYDQEVHVLRRHSGSRGMRRPQPGESSDDGPITMRTRAPRGNARIPAPRLQPVIPTAAAYHSARNTVPPAPEFRHQISPPPRNSPSQGPFHLAQNTPPIAERSRSQVAPPPRLSPNSGPYHLPRSLGRPITSATRWRPALLPAVSSSPIRHHRTTSAELTMMAQLLAGSVSRYRHHAASDEESPLPRDTRHQGIRTPAPPVIDHRMTQGSGLGDSGDGDTEDFSNEASSGTDISGPTEGSGEIGEYLDTLVTSPETSAGDAAIGMSEGTSSDSLWSRLSDAQLDLLDERENGYDAPCPTPASGITETDNEARADELADVGERLRIMQDHQQQEQAGRPNFLRRIPEWWGVRRPGHDPSR